MTKTYTIPDEYRSGLWESTVEGAENGVFSARMGDPPFNHDFGGDYAFTSFETDGPATLRVRTRVPRDLSRTAILPASCGATLRRIDDSTLEIAVPGPCRFSLEPDGRSHPLLVFADPPETDAPDLDDPKVKAFTSGVTLPKDGRIELGDGETLYIAAGAVVQGGVHARGRDIRI